MNDPAPKSARKLSPERMTMVLEGLRKCPIYAVAAAKAGIYHKTLTYWRRRSEAGDDGYELVWRGVPGKFHLLCGAAIAAAHGEVEERFLRFCGIEFPGSEAYVAPNLKMMLAWLEWKCPEKWGKRRKADATPRSPILVVGGAKKPKPSTAASVRARQWKSRSKMVGSSPPAPASQANNAKFGRVKRDSPRH